LSHCDILILHVVFPIATKPMMSHSAIKVKHKQAHCIEALLLFHVSTIAGALCSLGPYSWGKN